ncbi:RNA methyltransferase [Aureimonas sp. SA4125]|uniref:TrmH family RNA methyltransferase n=1 Tax=Aureimonas sp. SA4125 TaxID=2826993 RepID=UPI001CC39879|nr:RNA methyltransferase [Aureimonas sp. SA4125]BDA83254.1 RNA methyltransferase [Aureimonas sp. SA4125]
MTLGPIPIIDPQDARLAAYRDVRERDLVGRQGFIAEGRVVIEPLLASPRFRPLSLLVLENRLAGLAPVLARVPDNVPVYVADRQTFDGVAGFPVHRGFLAHGEVLADPMAATRLQAIASAGGTVVVAIAIANHDNIGAIFRNAAAFGADAILLDATSCDPLYRKAIRVSAGSVFAMPYARLGAAEGILGELLGLGFRCFALAPGASEGLAPLDRPGPSALFLGAEGPGLPPQLTAQMRSIAIPMVPGFDSINVATAAAIALQRLYSRCAAAD